jgi:predicted Zn-ribbon and HTH transcriptional regulator
MTTETDRLEDKPYVITEALHDFQCQLCEHVWTPTSQSRESAKCPRCKSYRWRGENLEGEVDESKPYVVMRNILKLVCQAVNSKDIKCGHTWVPRSLANLPQKCPACQSYDWRGKNEY